MFASLARTMAAASRPESLRGARFARHLRKTPGSNARLVREGWGYP